MALAQPIIDKIRDEIGHDLDVSDVAISPDPAPLGDLETIYLNVDRGNYSTLRTALIVWKMRLADMQSRSFDATAGGQLFARNQRVKFLQRRVHELSLFVDYTLKGTNETSISPSNTPSASNGAEF